MSFIFKIVIVWVISIICCLLMKKIQPECFRLYVICVFIVLAAFTSFVCVLVFWE